MFEYLPTPTLLLDQDRTTRNIRQMQAVCDAHDVELWPHMKTHKMLEVARLQLEAGAKGLVCAKLGEAEAMLPSSVRRIFIAYSLVDPLQAPRLRHLAASLDELILACTSEAHAEALETLLATADLKLPVLMAVDTGQHREGARGLEGAMRLAACIQRQPHLELHGLYTHEGHAYGTANGNTQEVAATTHKQLLTLRDRLDSTLSIWPGCSVTAKELATMPGVTALRPGAYVFGDLSLAATQNIMQWDDVAVTILATVVDRPEPGLALIDAGSKTFSGDKTAAGLSGSFYDQRAIHITRCSEEHGFATGPQV
ncbi:MAG: alanine racemase, partial [Abitibacteriaceae bacterium]|nr:alanine racemase [Abditibacteriaceae bacterium]